MDGSRLSNKGEVEKGLSNGEDNDVNKKVGVHETSTLVLVTEVWSFPRH